MQPARPLTLHAAHCVGRGGGHERRGDAERGGLAEVGDLVRVLGVDEQPVRLLQRVAQLALEPVAGLKRSSAVSRPCLSLRPSRPTCRSFASEGSTGFRHWIILLILPGEDGSGSVADEGTTGVSVVYENEEGLLASAQLLFSTGRSPLSSLLVGRENGLKGIFLRVRSRRFIRHHRTWIYWSETIS